MKLLLGIVGEQFSGKDTVADYLQAKHGAFHIRQSHILDEILNILALEISRRNEIDLGMALRQVFGTHTVGNAVAKRLAQATEPLQVVQGIRFQEELDIVKRFGGRIIYITGPVEIRYERSKQRKEKTDDQEKSFDEFIKIEQTEPTEIGIAKLGEQADYKINNDSGLEELYQKVEDILTAENYG